MEDTRGVNGMLHAQQKFSLHLACQIRELTHLCTEFCLMDLKNPAFEAAIREARNCATNVRENENGHGLGPVRPHVAIAFLTAALGLMREVQQLAQEGQNAVTAMPSWLAIFNDQYWAILSC